MGVLECWRIWRFYVYCSGRLKETRSQKIWVNPWLEHDGGRDVRAEIRAATAWGRILEVGGENVVKCMQTTQCSYLRKSEKKRVFWAKIWKIWLWRLFDGWRQHDVTGGVGYGRMMWHHVTGLMWTRDVADRSERWRNGRWRSSDMGMMQWWRKRKWESGKR